MKPKNQRLFLLLLAIGAVFVAILLFMSAMRAQASFFYAPGDLAKGAPPLDRQVRIGGMVRPGSLRRHADGVTIDFLVGDESAATIAVRYTGITPDLFREGSGVIAEGRFQPGGNFIASEILAKHDESYMPPLAQGNQHRTESLD